MLAKIKARYRRDRPAIAQALGYDPGRLVAIETGWSDPHSGGETVARVTLDSGRILGYKPRSVGPEELWAAVVGAAERRLRLGLMAPRAVGMRTHGWVEWVPADQRAISSLRAHRRLGAIAALLDLLEVRDAHPANFVFRRGQPILVDAETVGHPRLPGFETLPSIILTGVLPWPPGTREIALLSALGGWPRQEAAIISGYRSVFRFLGHRTVGRWLAPSGVMGRFRRIRIRIVIRPTREYVAALRRGAMRLAPPPGVRDETAVGAILASERRDLGRGDIPRFEADLDGTDLRHEGQVIVPEFFARSGWSIITERLPRLGSDDARRSLRLLLSCLRLDQAVRGRRYSRTR
jgi:lantibiotic modifying enzyme